MIIDSHQHFWKYRSGQAVHGLMRVCMEIRRDFVPSDLESILQKQNIDGCITVQVDQTEEETLFMLKQAKKYSFIKSVVGWIDLRADNISGTSRTYFSEYDHLAGFRHILQAEEPESDAGTGFSTRNQ
jgi:L-fuconolactonase